MAEKRRRLSPEARREEILQAAKHLFATKGYNETKMIDIAREIKASRSIFEPYFKSKEEIYDVLFERWREELKKPMPEMKVEEQDSVLGLLGGILKQLIEDPTIPDAAAGRDLELRTAVFSREGQKNKILKALTPEPGREDDSLLKALLQLFREGQSRGEIRQANPVILLTIYYNIFFGASMNLQFYGKRFSDETIDLTMELFRAVPGQDAN